MKIYIEIVPNKIFSIVKVSIAEGVSNIIYNIIAISASESASHSILTSNNKQKQVTSYKYTVKLCLVHLHYMIVVQLSYKQIYIATTRDWYLAARLINNHKLIKASSLLYNYMHIPSQK